MCREPWASTTIDSTPGIPRYVQRLLEIHLLDEEDAPSTPCPVGPTVASYTWQVTQDLYNDVASLTPSFEPLQMIYGHLRSVWRPMRSLVFPHTHWERYMFIIWRTMGQSLVDYFWESYGTYGLHQAQRHVLLIFDLLRGLFFRF